MKLGTCVSRTVIHVVENAQKIKDELDSIKYGDDITFQQFLGKLAMSEESYFLALRHTIKRNSLFLKTLQIFLKTPWRQVKAQN